MKYVVQHADTMDGIAYKFGIRTSDLAAANGLAPGAFLAVGQSLAIPAQQLATTNSVGPVSTETTGQGWIDLIERGLDVYQLDRLAKLEREKIKAGLPVSTSPLNYQQVTGTQAPPAADGRLSTAWVVAGICAASFVLYVAVASNSPTKKSR